MKKIGKEPRLLPNVMEAIASLKEKQGSTQRQIVEHVAHVLRKSKDNSRNVTMQVRRALEHGLHSGLIKQRSGKFRLGLDRRDYAIFRRFKQIHSEPSDRRGRRGRRRRRRRSRRRRRGRRRAISTENELSEDDTESARSVTAGTPEPMDRRRRGRRRRRRGRRGRRRRRHHKDPEPNERNSDSSVANHKDSNAAIPPEKRRSEQEKIDYNKAGSNHNHHQERQQERDLNRSHSGHDDDDMVDCGNPECLCNVKQEDDSPRCMSRENNYYNDSYLN